MVFCWSYYQFGSRYVYDEKWSILRFVQKENPGLYQEIPANIFEKCSLPNDTIRLRNVAGMCVVPQLYFYLGYFSALWSRLAEIGIRTTFIVFTLIASLLFEELDERVETIAEKASNNQEYFEQEMAVELNELSCQYDLVCQLIEQINRSFGFVLLIITGHDFSIAIMDFSKILDYLEVSQEFYKGIYTSFILKEFLSVNEQGVPSQFKWTDYFYDPLFEGKFIFLRDNPFKICKFVHPILRFLLLLVVSNRVGSKVYTNSKYLFNF